MTANKNKFLDFFCECGNEIKNCIKTKWIGCFIGLLACIMTIVQIFTYIGAPSDLFNVSVVIFSVIGALSFIVLSLFRPTSSLAPIALMVCNILCLIMFIGSDGLVDYFSTQFFDGFSFDKFMKLPFAIWYSILSFVITFVISSVAIYCPQNKKIKLETKSTKKSFGSASKEKMNKESI